MGYTSDEMEEFLAWSRDLLARFPGEGVADPKDVKELELFREKMLPLAGYVGKLEPYQDPEVILTASGHQISPGHILPERIARDYVSRARQLINAAIEKMNSKG
jgi:hypothetical protein